MIEHINEDISVITTYNHKLHTVMPKKILWNNKEMIIQKLGYYHKRRVGSAYEHVFDVCSNTLSLRLVCKGDTLHWTLEEISDGL